MSTHIVGTLPFEVYHNQFGWTFNDANANQYFDTEIEACMARDTAVMWQMVEFIDRHSEPWYNAGQRLLQAARELMARYMDTFD